MIHMNNMDTILWVLFWVVMISGFFGGLIGHYAIRKNCEGCCNTTSTKTKDTTILQHNHLGMDSGIDIFNSDCGWGHDPYTHECNTGNGFGNGNDPFNTESTNLAKGQILQQAGVNMVGRRSNVGQVLDILGR